MDIEKKSTKLLLLLLLADLAFIVIHVCYQMHLVTDSLFSIERDLGYAEVYQYIKESWIVALLFVLVIKRRQIIYLSWMLLFMYVLLDDSFQAHENLGAYLVEYFALKPMFALRAQDVGELGVVMLFGFLLFTCIGISYLFSDSAAKRVSQHLFILVMLLGVFGVVVDMLHVAIPWGQSIWGVIEDGGEMVIMSIVVGYAFGLGYRPENPPRIQTGV